MEGGRRLHAWQAGRQAGLQPSRGCSLQHAGAACCMPQPAACHRSSGCISGAPEPPRRVDQLVQSTVDLRPPLEQAGAAPRRGRRRAGALRDEQAAAAGRAASCRLRGARARRCAADAARQRASGPGGGARRCLGRRRRLCKLLQAAAEGQLSRARQRRGLGGITRAAAPRARPCARDGRQRVVALAALIPAVVLRLAAAGRRRLVLPVRVARLLARLPRRLAPLLLLLGRGAALLALRALGCGGGRLLLVRQPCQRRGQRGCGESAEASGSRPQRAAATAAMLNWAGPPQAWLGSGLAGQGARSPEAPGGPSSSSSERFARSTPCDVASFCSLHHSSAEERRGGMLAARRGGAEPRRPGGGCARRQQAGSWQRVVGPHPCTLQPASPSSAASSAHVRTAARAWASSPSPSPGPPLGPKSRSGSRPSPSLRHSTGSVMAAGWGSAGWGAGAALGQQRSAHARAAEHSSRRCLSVRARARSKAQQQAGVYTQFGQAVCVQHARSRHSSRHRHFRQAQCHIQET